MLKFVNVIMILILIITGDEMVLYKNPFEYWTVSSLSF